MVVIPFLPTVAVMVRRGVPVSGGKGRMLDTVLPEPWLGNQEMPSELPLPDPRTSPV